jgi:hypothetical protein
MPKNIAAVYKHFAFAGGQSALLPVFAFVFYFYTKVSSVILTVPVSGLLAAANFTPTPPAALHPATPALPRNACHLQT